MLTTIQELVTIILLFNLGYFVAHLLIIVVSRMNSILLPQLRNLPQLDHGAPRFWHLLLCAFMLGGLAEILVWLAVPVPVGVFVTLSGGGIALRLIYLRLQLRERSRRQYDYGSKP